MKYSVEINPSTSVKRLLNIHTHNHNHIYFQIWSISLHVWIWHKAGFLNRRPAREKVWPALILNNVAWKFKRQHQNATLQLALCLHRTRAARRIKIHRTYYNHWCCLHWMWRRAARQIPNSKLLTRTIYYVLTQSSNDLQCFVASSVDTMWQQKTWQVWSKKSGHGKYMIQMWMDWTVLSEWVIPSLLWMLVRSEFTVLT